VNVSVLTVCCGLTLTAYSCNAYKIKRSVISKYIYMFWENVRTGCSEGIVPCPYLVGLIVVSLHLCLCCVSSVFLRDFGHHCLVCISFICMPCLSYAPWYSYPNNLQLKSTCYEVSNEISDYFWELVFNCVSWSENLIQEWCPMWYFMRQPVFHSVRLLVSFWIPKFEDHWLLPCLWLLISILANANAHDGLCLPLLVSSISSNNYL
jgi:hypothetical protein